MRHDRDMSRIEMQLARWVADHKLASRKLKTEVLYVAIAKYVEVAEQKSGWHRKQIIWEARQLYGVSERTVETAISANRQSRSTAPK